ncbi:MAG: hypothetical protein IPK50_22630 [Fibrobacterota bacterium]|nr:hypothetical protein [Fibrobacterota bacterium]QQS05040.1 MAG: hypothetical protein IPK50_22630 [Fibrobacterota bacterium]
MRPIVFIDIATSDAEIPPMNPILSKNGAGNLLMAKGIVLTLLGIVHVVGTFTFEATRFAGVGTVEMRHDYLVWFSGVGFFIVFMGLIDLLCAKPLKNGDALAWRIAFASAISTALLGTAGVILYGISPPLIGMVVGWAALAALALLDRQSH